MASDKKTGKRVKCSNCDDSVLVAEDVLLPNGWWGGTDGKDPPGCPKCLRAFEWIGVDWDRSLVEYDGWLGPDKFGKPIEAMVERVRGWLADSRIVKVVTARATEPVAVEAIREKCVELFGVQLPVTDRKDYMMIALYDDRAVALEPNTGRVLGGEEVE